jgi:hypothetical protein
MLEVPDQSTSIYVSQILLVFDVIDLLCKQHENRTYLEYVLLLVKDPAGRNILDLSFTLNVVAAKHI